MNRSLILFAAFILALAGAFALKGSAITPPPVTAGSFDTPRAMARLARILGDQRPHQVDSDGNDAVRARLLTEMRAIGLSPRVDDGMACNGRERSIACARVRNVVATIGPATGKHLLIVAHYDSTAVGPGASDDGIGVASALEIAANMRGMKLARPVTFLIDDGEEAGLIGARAFLDRDPLRDRIDSLINMESRGVEGPAIMFETNSPNAAAIATYARSSARPAANSMSADFAKLIPNSTDVNVFAERGWTTLNFAVIGNETRYHSPGDRIERLDPRSVQHMGSQALAAATLIARQGPPPIRDTFIYTDVLQRWLVSMPLVVGELLLGALIAGFAVASWRRRAFGVPVTLIAVLGSTAAAFVLQMLLGLFRHGDYWRAYPLAVNLAVEWTAMAVSMVVLLVLTRRRDLRQMRAGYWLTFLVVGAIIATIAPGSIIYFLLPPILAGLGMLIDRLLPGGERVMGLFGWVALFLTVGPLIALMEILLIDGPAWLNAPLASLIALPVLIEAREWARDGGRRAWTVPAGVAALGWIIALVAPAYSDDRQERLSIEHVTDADSGKAQWAVNSDGKPDAPAFARVGPWELGEMPYTRRRWHAAAPAAKVTTPIFTKVSEVRKDAIRTVTFRVAMAGAYSFQLMAPATSRLVGGGMGAAVRPYSGKGKDKFQLRCTGRSCDGALLTLSVEGAAPDDVVIAAYWRGLPPVGAALAAGRPTHARPQYVVDGTVVYRKVRI